MFDTSILISSIIFGSIGTGYVIYGKKGNEIMPMLCGVILMIYPYFITNIYYSVLLGIILMIIPFFIKA